MADCLEKSSAGRSAVTKAIPMAGRSVENWADYLASSSAAMTAASKAAKMAVSKGTKSAVLMAESMVS